jgi:uncharacterized protein (DUF1330 family)
MSIEPTQAQFEQLIASPDERPVVMVNLLRFRGQATGVDEADGITGAEAYARYGAAVAPFLERAGGRVLLALQPQLSVIGPAALEWDVIIAVEYPSCRAFLAMTGDPGYLAIHTHRAAALADSRLIACHRVDAGQGPPASARDGAEPDLNGQATPRPAGPSSR